MSEVQNDYLVGGSNYTIKPKVNFGIKVKSWSVETTTQTDNKYLKITYVHPVPDVNPEDWSTISELISFPGPKLGETAIEKNKVKYGFMNPLTAFIMNFATKEDVNDRIKAVFEKIGGTFDLTNKTTLHNQCEMMVKGLFNLIESKGLFSLDGLLICGYGAPKTDSEGNIKQYLVPAKHGQSGCYKPAFRIGSDEELPAEKVDGFKDDYDKKYNYWSYSRVSTDSKSEPVTIQADTSVPQKTLDW